MEYYHNWITKERVDEIVDKFIKSKDKKFQGKTIISEETSKDIFRVLKQEKSSSSSSSSSSGLYGTANFRFWARKRFMINDNEAICCKSDSKPVCLKEDIYQIILKAHIECNHKGKEATYKQIHEAKSYFPKALVELLVKECIHCNLKKEYKKVEFHDIVDLYFDL